MKKSKNFISLILVLLVSIFFITGCGNNTSKDDDTEFENASSKVESFKDSDTEETTEDNDDEEKTLVCTRTATLSDEVEADLRYEVTYKNGYVTYLKSTEKIISDNNDYLEAYKTEIESTYEPYKDVEYYNYEVTITGDTMTSSVSVDYSKIDTDELISIDSANSTLIKDGKIDIDDIQTLYESVGTTCE